jgi:cytochrome c biogenesis protein
MEAPDLTDDAIVEEAEANKAAAAARAAPAAATTAAPPPPPPPPPPPASPAANPLRAAYRRLLRELSSLPRAIAIMAAVTALGALGTVIPQNKSLEYYVQNYPLAGGGGGEDGGGGGGGGGAGVVLGFLSYDLLLFLSLDHVYSASYFYALLALLAASLAACTATTQWPTAKVAQRWRFARDAADLARLADGGAGAVAVLPRARLRDLARELRSARGGGYQTFVSPDGRRMYAFKGLAGRLGPIGVHAALLLTLFGTAYSGFGGWKGTAMVPEGQAFVVSDRLRPASGLSRMPSSAPRTALYVNSFQIDTRPDGSVAQFYSDLSLREAAPVLVGGGGGAGGGEEGGGAAPSSQQQQQRRKGYALGDEVLRKRISVNDPFRYGGVTMYQTDWSLVALQLRVLPATEGAGAGSSGGSDGGASSAIAAAASAAGDRAAAEAAAEGRAFPLPLASLEGKPGIPAGAKIWATYLPLEPLREPFAAAGAAAAGGADAAANGQQQQQGIKPPRGVSIIAKDPYLATFYDSKGQFAGVRRAGSGKPIDVEGVRLVLEKIVPATGLELKADPGVPFVYAGFGGLMVTTLVSYVSHSQVWAIQRGRDVLAGGRSNRAKVGFARDLASAADRVPEVEDAAELERLDALQRRASAEEQEQVAAAEAERARRAEEAEAAVAAAVRR